MENHQDSLVIMLFGITVQSCLYHGSRGGSRGLAYSSRSTLKEADIKMSRARVRCYIILSPSSNLEYRSGTSKDIGTHFQAFLKW